MGTPLTFKASDIITDMLQKIGVYAPGEQIADSDMSRGLTVLNDMIDQWQNERLFIYALTPVVLTLANTVQSYTIGPVGTIGNIVTGRPSAIQGGPGAASVTVGSSTYLVNVVSEIEWGGIESKNPMPGVPDTLYYDNQYPVGVLNVAPVPNATMALTFYQLSAFSSFANYSTQASFSQGTVDALKNNLAVTAKPYFTMAQLDPLIAQRAEITKEFIRTSGTTSRARLKRSPSQIGKPSGLPGR